MNETNTYKTYRARILEYLRNNEGNAYDVRTIAQETDIPKPSCYTYLTRLARNGKVKRTSRGFYQYIEYDHLPLNEGDEGPTFHNIRLVRKHATGSPLSPTNLSKANKDEKVLPLWDWEIKILRSPNGTIEVLIGAGKIGKGISPEALKGVLDTINFYESLGFRKFKDEWMVSFELAKDHRGFRIDGANCLTLREFGWEFKMYQKSPDTVRTEYRQTKPIPIREIYDFLNRGSLLGLENLKSETKELGNGIRALQKEMRYHLKAHDEFLGEIHDFIEQIKQIVKTKGG